MIHLHDLRIQYGDRVLFKDINFQINPSDKIALIGRNGVGKSTLFKLITGEISPDEGTIHIANNVSIGHLEQVLQLDTSKSIREAANEAFAEVIALEAENERLQQAMADATDYESQAYMDLLDEFNLNLERLNHHEVGSRDKKIEMVLKGLGFKPEAFDNALSTLSGGWQMRVQLAKLLLQAPNLLLLDEPTNHLDIEAIIWLEDYIQKYNQAVIVISHDRAFLRNTANRIIEIEHSKAYDYNLTYDKYLVQKEEIRQQQEAAFKNQQKLIADKERTIKRFMAKATKTSMAQSMQKQLDKIERIELDTASSKNMRIQFLPVPRSGRTVLKARDLHKSYGDKKVLSGLSFEVERGDRIAIVGQNGQGKTTLAKILLNRLEPSSGEVEFGSQLSIGYYAQDQADELEEDATIFEFMELRAPEGMRTRVRSILGAFMFSGEDVEKKIKVLSGGERARLAFAQLLMEPINLLVLDEPTNHLDMDSKEVLKDALATYEGTLIVVSHDRDFLSDLTSKTLELRDNDMHTYLGDINYFLEKRAMDNMRDVALYQSEPSSATAAKPRAPIDQDKLRALKKQVSNAEKKVLKIETEIGNLEKEMYAADFYERSDSEKITEKHAALKADLEKAEGDWEALVEELEAQ